MASQLTPFSIAAPGFYGLNTSDSPVDLSPSFALEASNCVIDKAGRIASRKGWLKSHANPNTDLSTSNVECIGELISNDGASTILAAGGGFLLKLASGVLSTLTYGGGGAAPTITANNWTFCQLNGVAMFWQRGFDPLIYEPAISTTAFRKLSERAGSAGTIYQCNEAISAYGRVWSADTTADKQTVVWSDLLTPHIWTGGTAGSLNLAGVWPVGGDEIVGLAAHNNFLFIFGRKQVLIYSGADTPSTMKMSDSLIGVGCVARDSIQNTGDDIIFLANDGVRSLLRTIQEKSAPLRTVSKNVHQDVIDLVTANSTNIKSGYSQTNTMYVITFGSSSISYCFDMRAKLEDGSSRVTTWNQINPKCFCEAKDGSFYLGQPGYVAKHTGYYDNGATYRMSYFTTWIDFGEQIRISILKKIMMTMIGITNQELVFKWAYDYVSDFFSQSTILSGSSVSSEYGVNEFGEAEYSGGSVIVKTIGANGSGSGKVLQFGMEALVGGSVIAIQRIDIYTKEGKFPA